MNKKGFANIILVIVAVVVLIGAGSYFAFVKKSEPVAQQPTPETTQTPNPQQPSPTPANETANWKTYGIKGTKYQIDYPTSFSVETNETSAGVTATFENSDKTIGVSVSNVPTGFGADWKRCSPNEEIQMNGTTGGIQTIQYLCSDGGSGGVDYYRIISGLLSRDAPFFYAIASVSEKEFNNPETRTLFKSMVASFAVK